MSNQVELLSFNANACTMCGHQASVPQQSASYRFCTSKHDEGNTIAHLHRTCTRCGYEWLTETSGGQMQAPPQDAREVALDIVKGLATELTAAGDALDAAAHVLKDAERGHAAGVAREAGKKAKAHAQSLMPTRS